MAGRRGSAVDHHCIAEPAVGRLALCDAVSNLSDHFSQVTRVGSGGWARSRVLRFCLGGLGEKTVREGNSEGTPSEAS